MLGHANLDLAAAAWLEAARLPALRRRHTTSTMHPRIDQLLENVPITARRGDTSRTVSSIVLDSRRVVPGSLFFALPGRRSDGLDFAEEAIERGAVGIVSERIPALPNPRAAWIQTPDARTAMARAARRFHGAPDEDLEVVGVTGTNGKTTTTYLLRHFLAARRTPTGLLGTVTYDLGGRTVPSFRTTPESVDVFALLAQMRAAGCRRVVMEVSSHGLEQRRVLGLKFRVAAFLNLTRDHLDYHGDLEGYFLAKARLFDGRNDSVPSHAVLNADDPWANRITALLPSGCEPLTFGFASSAEVGAEGVVHEPDGTTFTLRWPSGRLRVHSPLVGDYNVSNVLAAAACCLTLGEDPADFLPTLADFAGVPGRMEAVREGQPFRVFVDYAHTDDALRNALGMLRGVTPGRLLVVFGCGGNRDRTKRPLMVRAVQERADLAWATADNPRSEPLEQIFEDMRTGVVDPARIVFVDDRRLAISQALDAAAPGDTLLIAGKGHEAFQEFADTVIPFDDRQVARELLAVKRLRTD